jgi:hypothetical protein
MGKMIKCVFAATVVAQIWGMISWMALPWHNMDFVTFKDDSPVAEVIREQAQGSGLYTLPNMNPAGHEDEAVKKDWDEKARKGPFVFMSVVTEGVPSGMGVPMAVGLGLNILISALLLWMVNQTTLTTVMGRATFIGVAGMVGSLYPHISNWNWWHFPLSY